MSNFISIDSYTPSSSDSFFFDNNIWMYLYCPIGNYAKSKQTKYGTLLQQLITRRNNIFINSLVLSEFTNAWLRMEFEDWKLNNQGKLTSFSFKRDFIGSMWYKQSVDDINAALLQIEKVSTKGNDDFNAIDMQPIRDELYVRDFNDNYYLELAQKRKWHIVTDDADFFVNNAKGIKIISATK